PRALRRQAGRPARSELCERRGETRTGTVLKKGRSLLLPFFTSFCVVLRVSLLEGENERAAELVLQLRRLDELPHRGDGQLSMLHVDGRVLDLEGQRLLDVLDAHGGVFLLERLDVIEQLLADLRAQLLAFADQ